MIKSTEEYQAYCDVLLSEFRKQSVEILAAKITLMIIKEEMRKDAEQEFSQEIKVKEREREDIIWTTMDLLDCAHTNATNKIIELHNDIKTAKKNCSH